VSRRPAAILAALLAIGSWIAGACSVTGTIYSDRDESHTFQVGLAPTVSVETFNGRINVTAAGDGRVEVRVSARGAGTSVEAADRNLANIEVTFEQDDDRIIITARPQDRSISSGNSGADVEVGVPEQSSLELRTSNGRIESANVTGTILAHTSNGAITTRGGHDLDLDTSNGPVSINGASGSIRVRTSNGALDIVGARRAEITASTSNAPLTFSGTLLPGEHSFRTSNGDLTLIMPADAAFSVDGETSNGEVKTDFDRLIITESTIKAWTGDYITTSITARTSNGDLSVMALRP
jgi:DUF4097 and DUF4098 domain-containing protein YvlB